MNLRRSLWQESKWLSVAEFQVATSLLFEFNWSMYCVAPFIVSCIIPSSVITSVLHFICFSLIFNKPMANATFSMTKASVRRWETCCAKVLWCFRQRRPILLAKTLWFFSPTSVLDSFGLPYLHISPTMCMVLWKVGSFQPLPSVRGKVSRNKRSKLAMEALAEEANCSCWESFQ